VHDPAHPQPAPPEVTRRELPGLGRRYDLETADGSHVVAVVHHSRRCDVYVMAPGSDEPDAAVTLTPDQARMLAAILTGAGP